MTFRTLDDVEGRGRRALVRVDFNVPVEDGRVSDDTRLRAALPTIRDLRAKGAKVVLLSHFDRPKGKRVPSMSLGFLVAPLASLVGAPVAFAKALAGLGDLYVNDAFSAAHRAHASTEGLAHLLPAYAGRSMQRELEHLEKALGSPDRPVMGIVGGAKVSTKLDLLNNLVGKLQYLAIGGGMANTFRFAQGYDVGGSLCEKEMADTARAILDKAKAGGCQILLPTDVVVARALEPGAPNHVTDISRVGPDDKIFDVGPNSLAQILDAMSESRTLVWNGPLGVFEVPPFDKGTVEAARHAAKLAKAGKLIAVAGGGDTVSALNVAGVTGDFTFVSTAGGAFLEWMEGKTLPGVAALDN